MSLVVTVAGIRSSESCNTLPEIVGFTASVACDLILRFFITREMVQKFSNPLEREILFRNSKCCCCWDVVTSLPVQPSRCHLWEDSTSRYWKRRRREILYLYQRKSVQRPIGTWWIGRVAEREMVRGRRDHSWYKDIVLSMNPCGYSGWDKSEWILQHSAGDRRIYHIWCLWLYVKFFHNEGKLWRKFLKPTGAGDPFPKFKVLRLLRCRDVASRSAFAMPFVRRFFLEIMKKKTKRNSLNLSDKISLMSC